MSRPAHTDARAEMLRVNTRQKAYYETTNGGEVSRVNGVATNLWRRLRARALAAVSDTQKARVYDIHRDWLGDLSGKKVLELGCGTGTPLTPHLVRTAGAYHAIDLSRSQIETLRKRFGAAGNTHFHVGDFLDDDFAEIGFDVIYAHSVFHHFRHLEVLCDAVEARLAPDGEVITYDPLQAWLPIRVLRAAYRPFQTDAQWEFPFTRRTDQVLAARFRVCDRFGVYGKAKWALALGLLSPALGRRFGDAWFGADLARGRGGETSFEDIRTCLHISYRLRRHMDIPTSG